MINIGTPHIALVNDALSIYEQAFTRHLGSVSPMEVEAIHKRVTLRFPHRIGLIRTAANVRRARNIVRHAAGTDIDYPSARGYINEIESALLHISYQEEATRVADLRNQLDSINQSQWDKPLDDGRNIWEWFGAQNIATQLGLSMFLLPLLLLFATGLLGYKVPGAAYDLLAWSVGLGVVVGFVGFIIGGSDS